MVSVEPFCVIGLITLVSAIQNVNVNLLSKPADLPLHLQHLVDYIAGNLDGLQRSQLSAVLQLYTNLFPLPGSKLTDHTDAVQHEIDTDVCLVEWWRPMWR